MVLQTRSAEVLQARDCPNPAKQAVEQTPAQVKLLPGLYKLTGHVLQVRSDATVHTAAIPVAAGQVTLQF
jgi:hypothetical protein